MSLDVYLTKAGAQHLEPHSAIFIREDGQMKEISREEWDKRYPGREPVTVELPGDSEEVFSRNITHNLNTMADAAGLYGCLWRPEEIGIVKASQLIEPLRAGLGMLKSDPNKFRALNPSNGWGDYDGLVNFVEAYLTACEEYPDADVSVSR